VPSFQRWVNNKKFDGGRLTEKESELRDFYKRLLNFTISSDALMGDYQDIHFYNKEHTQWYNHHVLSYVRWSDTQKLIVVSNFHANDTFGFELQIPEEIIRKWGLSEGDFPINDVLYASEHVLKVKNGIGILRVDINPLESFIFELN
jgi:glycosidase